MVELGAGALAVGYGGVSVAITRQSECDYSDYQNEILDFAAKRIISRFFINCEKTSAQRSLITSVSSLMTDAV